MIASHGRNFIFIHAPKTGGTSMALALEARAMKDDMMLGDTPKAMKRRRRLKGAKSSGRLWKHSTLADLDGLLSREFIEGAFTFTLVRNPWDRMVSYYHWLRESSLDHPAAVLARQVSFTEFVLDPMTQASLRAAPARYYLTDISGYERASLYIRLENFAEDASLLFNHLGFEFELPHANTSSRACDFSSYYNDEARSAVASFCAEDIERFGYRFSI